MTAIQQAAALRSGSDWLVEHLMKAIEKQQAQAMVKAHLRDFLNQHPGLQEVSRFTRDGSGKPIEISLRSLQQVPRTQLPQAVADTTYHRLAEAQETLERLAVREKDQLATAMAQEVQKLVNQPGGLTLAAQFLQALIALLAQQKQKLEEQVGRAEAERERREIALQQVQSPSWWRRFSINPRGAYLKRASKMAAAQLNELRQRVRLNLADQLLEFAGQLQQECSAWRTTLERFQGQLAEALDDHWEREENERSIAVEWVVCHDEIDRMYAEHCTEVLTQASEHLALTWRPEQNCFMLTYTTDEATDVERWSVTSATGIAKHAAHFQRFWTDRLDRSVEDILAERGKSPEEVLAELEYKAAPLIKVDDTMQIPAEKALKILGSETKTFWQHLVGQTGLSMVATGNRHRISLLYTVHGFNPLDGLMQSQAWKQAYEDAVASGRSPHIFPEMMADMSGTTNTNGHEPGAEDVAMKEGTDDAG